MDTSDPAIRFDDAGVCHHCRDYDAMIAVAVPSRERARLELDRLIARMRQRAEARRSDHDCVIGLSGGVESSFVAWLTHEHGLRPLAVHVDNGRDTELAVQNIERIVTRLGIELHTVVLDWDEFRDLQLSFLRASTPDCEVPTDHAIVSSLYGVARDRGIPYILSGCNARTESHLPPAWSRGHDDWRYIRSIQQRFSSRPLTTFPHRTRWRQWRDRRTLRWVDVLNLVDYRKHDAIAILEKELGWRSFGAKHFESIYTRFFQGYLLPTKFGFDKRRMHLSSMICAAEITREPALATLSSPPIPRPLRPQTSPTSARTSESTPRRSTRSCEHPCARSRTSPRTRTRRGSNCCAGSGGWYVVAERGPRPHERPRPPVGRRGARRARAQREVT